MIEQLEKKVLSATTFTAITSVLLEIEAEITQCDQQVTLSGNMTDKSIIELEGKIRALKTLKFVGNARVSEIQDSSYKGNKRRYDMCKLLKKEMPDLYEQLMERVKQ